MIFMQPQQYAELTVLACQDEFFVNNPLDVKEKRRACSLLSLGECGLLDYCFVSGS
jgi:hypothetical protein